MAICDETGRTNVELQPGPTPYTLRCPACQEVLAEDTLLPVEELPEGNRRPDGTPCLECGEREAIWDYNPFVAEIHPEADAEALLCDKCFGMLKDEV